MILAISYIFMFKNGELLTPPQSMGTLRGVTRDTVLALARTAKISASEQMLTRHEIFNADEAFLTGAAAELIPVVEIDGRIIGGGKPGKLTLELMKRFKQVTRKQGVRYKV